MVDPRYQELVIFKNNVQDYSSSIIDFGSCDVWTYGLDTSVGMKLKPGRERGLRGVVVLSA